MRIEKIWIWHRLNEWQLIRVMQNQSGLLLLNFTDPSQGEIALIEKKTNLLEEKRKDWHTRERQIGDNLFIFYQLSNICLT